MEKRAKELVTQLDVVQAERSQLVQERDNLLKTIESLKSDRNQLDRNRTDLNSMMDSLSQGSYRKALQ